MSELFSWFAQITREHFGAVAETGQDSPRNFISGAGFSAKPPCPPGFADQGNTPSYLASVGNGADSVESALQVSGLSTGGVETPLYKDAISAQCEAEAKGASNRRADLPPQASVISIEMARVQRVMEAHSKEKK